MTCKARFLILSFKKINFHTVAIYLCIEHETEMVFSKLLTISSRYLVRVQAREVNIRQSISTLDTLMLIKFEKSCENPSLF